MAVQDAALEPPLLRFSAAKRIAAEALGTALLVAVVVGSGTMAEHLSLGNAGLALLANAIATGAALIVLIVILGPISGAHFNPVVSAAFALRGELAWPTFGAFTIAQVIGACCGSILANGMFGLPLFQVSTHVRAGLPQGVSEAVATFGLILAILGSLRFRPAFTPVCVGLYITAAYWFTASTSFANPAVTLARTLTDTFAGIAPASAPLFIIAQIIGMGAALGTATWLLKEETPAA